MVMIGGTFLGSRLIYDVSDPLHPRLLCTIAGTTAHLFTGDTFAYLKAVSPTETDVILRSLGSGNESKAASFPYNLADPVRNDIEDSAWTPDGSLLAYTTADETVGIVRVWLYSKGHSFLVHTYGEPIGDCICRFGLPQQVLAFSPDGQYLSAGWVAGKGSTPLSVIRISDGAALFVAPDTSYYSALWDRSGHRLFLFGTNTSAWTPESGLSKLPGGAWQFLQGISPDGTLAAYTAYSDPNAQLQPRVYAYDLKAGTTRLLVDKLRTQVLFVKDGWVWYLEERACTSSDSCAGSTTPTGKVFAMQLSTSVEQVVTFAKGEDPIAANWWTFTAGEYWPNS
jgi:WD40 repeat protein